MAKNAKFDAAYAATIAAMEVLDFSKPPAARQRTLFEVILYALEVAERDRETRESPTDAQAAQAIFQLRGP